jgi:hypothetical protein
VSPRSNKPRKSGRRRGPAPEPGRLGTGIERTSGGWTVRSVTGAATEKSYRCPGCDQLITPGTPHVVAWPDEFDGPLVSGPDERRHWHTPCWGARDRRHRR